MQIGVYDNYTITIKSNATRNVYRNNLNLFMQFLGITDYDQLLKINAEDAIKQYIIYLKGKVSSATLHNRIAAIYHFYTMNDVILNKTKISKYKGEFRRVKSDRAYSYRSMWNMQMHEIFSEQDSWRICELIFKGPLLFSSNLTECEYVTGSGRCTRKTHT